MMAMEGFDSGDTDSSFTRSSSAPAESSSSLADPEASVAAMKPRYSCSFQSSSKFPWAIPSHKGDSYALCKICKRHISVAFGIWQSMKLQQSMSREAEMYLHPVAYPSLSIKPMDQSEIHLLLLQKSDLVYFVGEHHLPISIADHCTKLFPLMFPDSTIARSFKCCRTKTTSVIKVIARDVLSKIAK